MNVKTLDMHTYDVKMNVMNSNGQATCTEK